MGVPGRKGDVSQYTHVFTSSRWKRAIFWTLIVVLMLLTIRDVVYLIIEYTKGWLVVLEFGHHSNLGEKEADMSFVFNTTMIMPPFTFCIPMPMVNSIYNSSKFKASVDTGEKDSHVVKVKHAILFD